MITEDQLEQLCLDWFQAIGYEYVCGYDIAPDGGQPGAVIIDKLSCLKCWRDNWK